ncbi:MAG: hypothetical protein JSR85_08955 [Proteobacteria bacterium]|nr:hypothetical protein [Pseudomonadota bacterium]
MRVNIFMTLIFLGTGLINHPCYSGLFQSKPVPGVQIEDNRRGPARAAAAAAPPPVLPVHQDPSPPVAVAAPPVVLVHDPLPGVVPVAPPAPDMQVLAATLQAALQPGHTGSVTIHLHMAPPLSGPALVPVPSDVGPSTALAPLAPERTPSFEAPKPAVLPAQPVLVSEERKLLMSTPAAAASSADQPLDRARGDSLGSLVPIPSAAASSADQLPEDSRFQIVVSHQNVALMLPKSLVLRDQGRYQLALMPKICALFIYDSLSKANHEQFLDLNRKEPADAKAISTALQWVNHYLEHYGTTYGQFESARQLTEALERTIGSADLSTTKIKFGLDKANKKLIFSMEVSGGYVVFGKIPGHE